MGRDSQLEMERYNELIDLFLLKHCPLHKFQSVDVSNMIQWWMYNDINYKDGLLKTMQIFSAHSLNGEFMIDLPTNNAKLIVQNKMVPTLMTSDTFNIMFKCFD